MVMRDEPVLTSFTVACGSGGDWEVRWKINGETTAKVIDYGVTPKGMTTISLPLNKWISCLTYTFTGYSRVGNLGARAQ